MASKVVAVQSIVRKPDDSLIDPAAGHTAPVVADGDFFEVPGNDGRVWLSLKNGGNAAATVTVVTVVTEDELELGDRAVQIPANSTRLAGPWPPATYGSTLEVYPNAGRASLELAAMRLGQ